MKTALRLCLVLLLCLCLGLALTPAASAEEDAARDGLSWAHYSGTCGDDLTWTLTENGVLEIRGRGAMENYSQGTAPWYGSRASITAVDIGSGVTSIGDYAFFACINLTEVNIPQGVTSIGRNAFNACNKITDIIIPEDITKIDDFTFFGCSSLSSVIIPEGVASIGEYAFYGCSSLTSVTIPEGVTTIGGWTFYGCSSLTGVNIPEGVTSIGYSTFYGCRSLTGVTIPEGATTIGNFAFSGCTSLTSVTIPDSVTSIGSYAFDGCSSLTGVTIPDSVTSIGYAAFQGCTSLTSVNIPEGVTSIGDRAFYGCSGLTSVNIPEGVTNIGNSAFSGCSSLTGVTIPYGVTTINGSTFYGCSSLTSVTIPDSVTSIDYYTFSGCSSLTSVTIPDSVTSIGHDAFYGCSNLTDVYYNGTRAQWNEISIGTNNGYLTRAAIHCTDEIVIRFEPVSVSGAGTGTMAVQYAAPNAAVTLSPNTFSAPSGMAFAGWNTARDGSGVSYRDEATVTSDTDLTLYAQWSRYSETVAYHPNGGSGAPQAQTMNPGGTLTLSSAIPVRSGYYFVGWAESPDADRADYLPGGSYTKEESATLYAVWAEPDFALPAALTVVEGEAFANCAFRFALLPESAEELGANAFAGCGNLRYVYIPESCIYISRSAFGTLSDLTILGVRGSTAQSFARQKGYAFVPTA